MSKQPCPTRSQRGRGIILHYAPRLLLAGLAGVATLKLADAMVGYVGNTHQRHLLRLVPGASLRHKSNEFDYVFRANKLGLRGPDIPFPKPAGTFRIIVLGDSFVAGYGVAEEYLLTTLLQYEVAAEHRTAKGTAATEASPVEVVNVGRVGTSTIREFDLYEALGRRFQPDLVILAYYIGNDLAEVTQEQTRAELAEWHPGGWPRRLAYYFIPNLYLELAMIRQSRRQHREFARRAEREILDDLRSEAAARARDPDAAVANYESLSLKIRENVASGMLSEQRVIDSCIEPDRLERALNPNSDEFAVAWGRTVGHLDQLHRSVAHDGAQLVLVAIPAPFQIDRDSLEFHRALGYRTHDNWLEAQPHITAALEGWTRDANVPFLDLTEQFRHPEQQLYFIEDVHFTPAGNAAAARAICRFLLTQGLCP